MILIYFGINNSSLLFNKQDINANAGEYKVIHPYKDGDLLEFEEEELPPVEDMKKYDDSGLFDFSFIKSIPEDSFSKVGVLLPLTGEYSNIGRSILNSAEMSLFDNKESKIQLIIEDTKGTTIGAKMAAQLAISKGAQIILGPVFSNTTKSIQNIADDEEINIITLSNNEKLLNKRTLLMGFMPSYQIEKIVNYANARNYKKLAVLIPDNSYGDMVEDIIEKNDLIEVVKTQRIKDTDNVQDIIKKFTGYDNRKKALDSERNFYSSYMDEYQELKDEISNLNKKKEMSNSEFFEKYARYKELKDIEPVISRELEKLNAKTTQGKLDFDSILIAFGGDKLREIASLLSYYDVSPRKVKYLGTGLFDDDSLNDEEALIGAWYATPYSGKAKGFEDSYIKNFNEKPIRIATIAYDAISLLSYYASKEKFPEYDYITNGTEFSGLDGAFSFQKDGTIYRDLSIMQIRRNKPPKKIN